MKKNYFQKCLLLCLALLVGQTVMAQIEGFSGTGTEEDPYLIKSKADWDNANAFIKTVGDRFIYHRNWRLECDLVGENAITKMHKNGGVIFDGNGHTVELQIDGGTESVAMFYIEDPWNEELIVSNLHIIGTIKGQGDYCASIAREAKYIVLKNIHCEVTLESTGPGAYWGGLVGHDIMDGGYIRITNCAFTGTFKESENAPITKAGGLIGKSEVSIKFINSFVNLSGSNVKDAKDLIYDYNYKSDLVTVENTYYVNKYGDAYGTAVTEAQAMSGEICYKLGENQEDNPWRQDIGVEKNPHPLGPDYLIVKKYGDNLYLNEKPKGSGTKDDPYQITHAKQWPFISILQTNTTVDTYYVLCNDITLDSPEYIFNSLKNVHIDGQGHTVTLDLNGESVDGNVAMFKSAENCTIKNMKLTGTVKAKGTNSASLIGKATTPITLENISNDVTLEEIGSGDTWGGIIGAVGKGSTDDKLTFTACSYTGKLLGKDIEWNGGFVGFAGSDAKVIFNGCFADITGSTVKNTRDIIRSHNNFENVTFKNTFYIPFYKNEQPGAIVATESSLKSGEACRILNNGLDLAYWKQELGTDPTPQLFDSNAEHIVWKSGDKYYNDRPYIVLSTPFNTGYVLSNKSQIHDVYVVNDDPEHTSSYVFYTQNRNIYYGFLETSFKIDENHRNFISKLVNGKVEYDGHTEYSENPYYIYLDKNILSKGRAFAENGIVDNTTLSGLDEKEEKLMIAENTKHYEFMIMEGGRPLHLYLPAKRGKNTGFYDAVCDTFLIQKNATLSLDQKNCFHEYTKVEHSKGVRCTHCMLCDKTYDFSFFGTVKYDSNLSAKKSHNDNYNKIYGAMMYQDIDDADTLKHCLFRRPMHIFGGWNTQADGKGKAYADNAKFECTEELCDTVKLYAQWTPAYRSSDGTLCPIPASGEVNLLDIVDNGLVGFAAAKDFKAKKATYTMAPKKGHQWGTICLPFEVESQEGIKFYTTGAVKGDNIELSTEVESVPAGTPAIYHLDEPAKADTIIVLQSANKTVSENVKNGIEGELLLSGVLDYQNVKCDTAANTYYGIMYDKFYRVETTITLNPYRAYFYQPKAPAPLQVYNLLQTGNPTGIERTYQETGKDEIYDLSGRRLQAPRKGINIINGKKVVR